jgi:hypothetical protein
MRGVGGDPGEPRRTALVVADESFGPVAQVIGLVLLLLGVRFVKLVPFFTSRFWTLVILVKDSGSWSSVRMKRMLCLCAS